MKNNQIFLLWIPILFLILMSANCSGDADTFSETAGGVQYHFYEQNFGCDGVIIGDLITANVVFRTEDTVFFNSANDLNTPYQFEILQPRFQGDIFAALMIMCQGDSATFRIKGDSLFIRDFEIGQVPSFIGPDTWVYMDIRLQEVMPKDQFELEKERYRNRTRKMEESRLQKEQDDIRAFITAKNIGVMPTESGLYFLEITPGSGESIREGDTVTAHYAAMFISGEIFETTKQETAMKNDIFDSSMTYAPFRFIQGDTLLIPGWNEGVALMKRGGKARLLLPSALAYGDHGVEGLVPPFTPLIYEIEILEVE
jgi:FKBP-type peptidyl-prolyl cis-trans isomerase FkpA